METLGFYFYELNVIYKIIYRVTTKNVMKCDGVFLILKAINTIEIFKNRVILFVLMRHFTTSQET